MNELPLLADLCPVILLIWIWMAYTMLTDALKDSAITPPQKLPRAHGVVGRVVDNTNPTGTLPLRVYVCQTVLRSVELGRATWATPLSFRRVVAPDTSHHDDLYA